MNGNPRPVIPDTISGQLRAGLSPEFLSPYADGEVANRPGGVSGMDPSNASIGFPENYRMDMWVAEHRMRAERLATARLTSATWVLVLATVVLALATSALVVVTFYGH